MNTTWLRAFNQQAGGYSADTGRMRVQEDRPRRDPTEVGRAFAQKNISINVKG